MSKTYDRHGASARVDRPEPRGRRARERAAQQQAARRRRIGLVAGIGTAVVVIVIALAAVLLDRPAPSNGAALTNANALNPAQQLLPMGSKAPDFNLATVDGKHYRLSALRGHTVLLEFFAVWCPICQAEAPTIHRIDATLGNTGLKTLAILANPYGRNYENSGRTDLRLADKGDVQWFERTFKVTHPSLIDPNFSTVNRYGAYQYPTLYVIDPKGTITYANAGERPYSELASAIKAASKS